MFPRFGKIAVLILCFVLGCEIHAQDFPVRPSAMIGTHVFLRLLLKETKYFGADMDAVLKSGSGRTLTEFTAPIQSAPEAFRCELEAGGMKFPLITDEAIAAMRRIGVNKQVMIVRMDKGDIHDIYPEASVHHSESIPHEALETIANRRKETELKLNFEADEKINGEPCKKYRLIVHEPKVTEEGTVWLRPGKNGLPVKLQYGAKDQQYVMTFRNISTNAPRPEIFDVPTNSVAKKNRKEMISAAKEAWLQKEIDRIKARESN